MASTQGPEVLEEYATTESTSDEFSDFNTSSSDASGRFKKSPSRQERRRKGRIKKRKKELAINRCVSTKMQVQGMQGLAEGRIDTCAEVNLISNAFVHRSDRLEGPARGLS